MSLEDPRIVVVVRETTSPSLFACALDLAERWNAHITAAGVFTPEQPHSLCQDALDLGFDKAICVHAELPLDFLGEALLLRPIIQNIDADLVLCPDDDNGSGGAALCGALSTMLEVDCIPGVSSVTFEGGELLVTRQREQSSERIRCTTPRLLALGNGVPFSLPAKSATSRRPKVQAASDVLSDLSTLESRSPLAQHAALEASPEAAELFTDASALLDALRNAKLWSSA
jgi:electron transfer flavoprotein alpha/beta subunit